MKALSIRQPWAWLIVHGPKRFENRCWSKAHPGRSYHGEVLIHASAGMTRQEYEDAAEVAESYEVQLPPAAELERGGIIGQARIIAWHDQAPDMPFAFSSGFELACHRIALPFQACKGSLGFFNPVIDPDGKPEPPPKWSLAKAASKTVAVTETPELFANP